MPDLDLSQTIEAQAMFLTIDLTTVPDEIEQFKKDFSHVTGFEYIDVQVIYQDQILRFAFKEFCEKIGINYAESEGQGNYIELVG